MVTPHELTPLDIRLWALETILAYVVASQHMQDTAPKAALERLSALVIAGQWSLADLPDSLREAALAELARVAERIHAIQSELPPRLVD